MITKLFLLFLVPWSATAIEEDYLKTILAVKEGIQDYSNSFAIGARTYKELVKKSKLFIDNTLFIKDVLEDAIECLLLIARPKWGRTMNLDMIKTFLEIEVDHEGNEIFPKESTVAYKLFMKGEITSDDGTVEKLTSPLAIEEYENVTSEYLGKFPVLYIDYANVGGANMTALRRTMNDAVAKAFEPHIYLMKILERNVTQATGKKKRAEAERKLKEFKNIIEDKEKRYDYNDANLLCELLHDHYKRKIFVIIDNYDLLLLSVYQNDGFSEADLKYLLTHQESVMGSLFTKNQYVEKGIVSATFQLQRINDEYQWTNFIAFDTLWIGEQYSEYYGLRQSDLPWLFEKHQIDPPFIDQVFKWYAHKPCEYFDAFYNPTTIARFLNEKKIDIYWKVVTDDELVISKLRTDELIRKDILSLLSNQTITLPHVDHVLRLTEVQYLNNKQEFPRRKILWYLYRLGYLMCTEKKFQRHGIRLPNNEATYHIATWMISYYRENYNLAEKHVHDAAVELLNFINDSSTQSTALQKSLENLYKNHRVNKSQRYFDNEDPVCSILSCVAIKIQCLTGFEVRVYHKKLMAGDIVIMDPRIQRAAFIEVTLSNETIHQAFAEAFQYHKIFRKFRDMKTTKFIALEITPSNSVNIMAELRTNNRTRRRRIGRKNCTATPRARLFDEDVYFTTPLWQSYDEDYMYVTN